jgi:hypothetical protein
MSRSDSPALEYADITPNDGADLPNPVRGVLVGVSGDLKLDDFAGNTVTLKALVAGVIHPIGAKRIYSTGTTATDIVGVL